jgi:oxalate decarboxylase
MNRRAFIGASSGTLLALAAMRANGQSLEDITKAQHDDSAKNLGPTNATLDQLNSDVFMPPPTDRGEPPQFWSSFSEARRRVQPGGWTRQVTVQDFPISKDIAGVNMRLTTAGIRELHWHNAGEWGIVLSGKLRLTCIDSYGRAFIDDLGPNDIWFFPTGVPHSIQGLPPDGTEFLLVFDDGKFTEDNTTLISDWLRHTPPEVVAKNFGLTEQQIAPVYNVPPEGKFIFVGSTPGSLEDDQKAAYASQGPSPTKFSFHMSQMKPDIQREFGEVRIIDSHNFPVANPVGTPANAAPAPASLTVSAAYITVKPGGLRELHWHQNADEWQYYIKGKGRMTVFFNGAHARTADFNAGDVGYVPRTLGHYIENTGSEDLVFLEMFKAPLFEDLSLSEWVTHIPAKLLKDHIGISKDDVLSKVPDVKQAIVPVNSPKG